MFKYLKNINSSDHCLEISEMRLADDVAYEMEVPLGSILFVNENGELHYNFGVGATAYLALEKRDAAIENPYIKAMRITPGMLFETKCKSNPASINRGRKISLETNESSFLEVVDINGSAMAVELFDKSFTDDEFTVTVVTI